MTSRFQQDRAAEARDAQIASQTEAFHRFLEGKHPGIRFSIALLNAVREYMMDAFLTAGDEDFEYALQNMDTHYMRQHVLTPEETKAALIDKVCSLIASSDGTGRDGKFSTFALQTERTKMVHSTIPQLTQRLDEILRKQRLASKSASELKQIVAEARRDDSPYPGFPTLDKSVQASHIKALSSAELKKLVRLHSADQVNARLAGRS